MRIESCFISEIGEQDDFYNIANQIIGKKGTADDIEYKGRVIILADSILEKVFIVKIVGQITMM